MCRMIRRGSRSKEMKRKHVSLYVSILIIMSNAFLCCKDEDIPGAIDPSKYMEWGIDEIGMFLAIFECCFH